MDKFLERVFLEFGDDLESVECKKAKENPRENEYFEALEKDLTDEQKDLLDKFIQELHYNIHEENYEFFISGLKFALKIFKI